MQVLGKAVRLDDAKEIVLSYCFDNVPLGQGEWEPFGRYSYGERPHHLTAPKWAYRFYDCSPRSEGNELTTSDLLIISGLEMRFDFETLRALHAIAPFVSDALSQVKVRSFWDLPEREVPENGRPAPENTDGWWLGRAWWLLMSLDSVGVATTHKILHHKWPHLFPLIDNLTLREVRRSFDEVKSTWRVIYDDLNATPAEWEQLENWFNGQAVPRETQPITRLRLHDILLWWRADQRRKMKPLTD